MTERGSRWLAGALVAGLGGCTVAGLAITGGHPAAALAPVLGVCTVALVLTAPPRLVALALLALALGVESPQDRPASGLWQSPLYPLGQLLYDNLGKTLGVGGLPFSGMDVLLGLLLVSLGVRCLTGRWRSGGVAPAGPLTASLVLFAVALGVLGVWGGARGGDGQAAYWQVRQLVFLPVLALLFHAVVRGPGDVRALGRVVVGAALLKAAQGAAFYYLVAVPQGLTPDYVTTHADSVLFVGAVAVLVGRWLEARSVASARGLLALPPLLLALQLNDRRLAWVALVAALVLLVALARGPGRRAVVRALPWVAPVVVLYVAAGWGSDAAIFEPLQAFSSATDEADRSTLSREIENFNLARTVGQHPLLGQGLGHGYVEVVRGDDISHIFALYRHIPHNSVLWLLAAGGLVGFSLLWLPLGVGAYLAARTHRCADSPEVRAAALSVLVFIVLFAVQAWGDMGTQSWPPVFLLAAGLGTAGKLAVACGAWPAPQPGAPAARRTLEVVTA